VYPPIFTLICRVYSILDEERREKAGNIKKRNEGRRG
jgi:hypothetical protein